MINEKKRRDRNRDRNLKFNPKLLKKNTHLKSIRIIGYEGHLCKIGKRFKIFNSIRHLDGVLSNLKLSGFGLLRFTVGRTQKLLQVVYSCPRISFDRLSSLFIRQRFEHIFILILIIFLCE